jgi:hypothetical protein
MLIFGWYEASIYIPGITSDPYKPTRILDTSADNSSDINTTLHSRPTLMMTTVGFRFRVMDF